MQNEITKNIKDLKEKFLIIKKLNFVESLRKGNGGMCYTFEALIEKKKMQVIFQTITELK